MAWLAFGMMTRELPDGEVVVGSAAEAGWRVTTADLMPRHFVVGVRGSEISVRPCSTESVVAVNGQQVAGATPLRDGDVISAGSGRFAFNLDAPRTTPLDVIEVRQAHLIETVAGVAHPLNQRSTMVGRDASNEIVLRDPAASRFHAEIRNEAGGFALHSMGSAGVKVSGVPVKLPRLLHEGDVIEMGFAEFRFTQRPLPPGIGLAPLHSAENDEAARRPTIGSERSVVEEDNPASRHSTRVMVFVALVLIAVLALIVWGTKR